MGLFGNNFRPGKFVDALAKTRRLRLTARIGLGVGVLAQSVCLAITFSPVSPEPGATNASTSPELNVAVTSDSETNLTIGFEGREAALPARPDFSIIALPDTQFYSGSLNGGSPAIFQAQTDWIVSNRISRNIVFATQLGDCVQNGDWVEQEWWAATNAMYRLEDPFTTLQAHGIPYGVAVGNHDGPPPLGPGGNIFYNKYFGVAHFQNKPYYGGHFGTKNDNHFQLFSASGLDFITLHLEWDAGTNATLMAWANQVLETNRQRRAIVISHSIIYPSATGGVFSAQGQPIYDALKGNPNIFLTLSGHAPITAWRKDTYNGNTIHSIVSDFTHTTNGGNGWLRILQFSPSNNVIRVQTYSPVANSYYHTNGSTFFDIPYNMAPTEAPFETITNLANISSGTLLRVPWPDRTPFTAYQWRVVASAGTNQVAGPIWQFQTGAAASNSPGAFKLSPGFDQNGNFRFTWPSIGGARYRVEFTDSNLATGFTDIVRPEVQEIDPAPLGFSSLQIFVDDFQHTGGPPPFGSRLFRVRRIQ
jgi:hypothetical protein